MTSLVAVDTTRGKRRGFMVLLDFGCKKEDLKIIQSALRRRNLFMDKNDKWEVQGPHKDMNYQAYVGRAFEKPLPVYTTCTCHTIGIDQCKKHQNGFYVAIYPRAVYEIQSPEDWYKVKQDKRIALGGRNTEGPESVK